VQVGDVMHALMLRLASLPSPQALIGTALGDAVSWFLETRCTISTGGGSAMHRSYTVTPPPFTAAAASVLPLPSPTSTAGVCQEGGRRA
jgi:hypothetical protein